jgi:hypothetical protein
LPSFDATDRAVCTTLPAFLRVNSRVWESTRLSAVVS